MASQPESLMRPGVSVFLSPEYVPVDYQGTESLWVVTDVIRASTTICAALSAGAPLVHCCETPAEALAFKALGYCIAGEQNRVPFPGAEVGNSPQHFTPERIAGRPVALCTTNGTRALLCAARHSPSVVMGGFCNALAINQYLPKYSNRSVVVLASGWKGAPNLEDTLFAGWLVGALSATHSPRNDTALLAQAAYHSAQKSPYRYLRHADSTTDLLRLGLKTEVRLCLRHNIEYSVPILSGTATLTA